MSDARAATAIHFSGVGKVFKLNQGSVTALDGVTLSVPENAFHALIGPSGCGKSTLIRMVAGLEEPDTGLVDVLGRSGAELAGEHRIGFAMQDHALLPWLTVRANVALPFRVAGEAVDHQRVDALLDLVGLGDFADARPRQLSGGMRQRASMARSLVLDPAVLLLDEPFGALDAVTRRKLNLELQSLWSERQLTTILVTHSVDEAVFLADRVTVMSQRPGTVRLQRDVPFPRPRLPEVRRTPEFRELVDELTESLDAEAQGVL